MHYHVFFTALTQFAIKHSCVFIGFLSSIGRAPVCYALLCVQGPVPTGCHLLKGNSSLSWMLGFEENQIVQKRMWRWWVSESGHEEHGTQAGLKRCLHFGWVHFSEPLDCKLLKADTLSVLFTAESPSLEKCLENSRCLISTVFVEQKNFCFLFCEVFSRDTEGFNEINHWKCLVHSRYSINARNPIDFFSTSDSQKALGPQEDW